MQPDPKTKLERGVDGKLWLYRGDKGVPIDVVRCFPWTSPRRYLSLRDSAGEELAFLNDLSELDATSRGALEDTLHRASFVLEITEIRSITEDFELRSWRVHTSQGERIFQTPLDAWPRQLPEGGLMLQDVYGDLYRVASPESLDATSRQLLWAFMD